MHDASDAVHLVTHSVGAMLVAHPHLHLMQWLEQYLSTGLLEYSGALEQHAADVDAMNDDDTADGDAMDDDAVCILGALLFLCVFIWVNICKCVY